MARYTKSEIAQSTERLTKLLTPGTVVYCVNRHTSRSGMMRHIDFYIMANNEPVYISKSVATVLGMSMAPRDNGIKVGGCGMDMGFSVVYNLSATIFRDAKRDDHESIHNGEGDYKSSQANLCRNVKCKDTGYWLSHRWM